jgi:hypothetical protein
MKTIQTLRRILATIIVIGITWGFLQSHLAADQPEPVKQMLAAWRARQEAVKSGEIRWREQATRTNADHIEVPGPSGKPAPTTTVPFTKSLTFYGDKFL